MKWWIAGFVLISSGAYALQTRVLTIEEAVRIGMEKNATLLIASTAVATQDARAREAESRLYPALSFVAGYDRIEDGSFRFSTTNLPLPISVGGVVVDNYRFRVGVRQPLFTGFRLSSQSEAADLLATASRMDLAMARQDMAVNITNAYWSLYQSRQLVEFRARNVSRLESYRRDTERLVNSGLATQNDLDRVDVQLSSGRIEEIEARNDAKIAEMTLNYLLGQPTQTSITLASDPLGPDGANGMAGVGDVGELLEVANHQRSDLLAASTKIRAAGAGVKAAESGWWPQIELTAGYMYNNPNTRYQPITPEFLGSWDVGVSLAFDVWNWGATGGRVEEAEARLKESELHRALLSEKITMEVQKAVLNVNRAKEMLSVAKLAISQANENLRATSEKYRTGLATSTELLDAEVSLLDAQTRESGVKVQYAVALAELSRSVGAVPLKEDLNE